MHNGGMAQCCEARIAPFEATALFLHAHFNREFIAHPRRNFPDLVLVTIED
jgi:hypothetical protein